eukprot:sb/3472060/
MDVQIQAQPGDAAYPPQGGAYPPQGGAYPPQGGAYPPPGGAYPPPGGAYPAVPFGSPPEHIVAKYPDTNCEACNHLRAQNTRTYYSNRLGLGLGNPNARLIIPIHIGVGIFFLILSIVLGIVVPGYGKIPALMFTGFCFGVNFLWSVPTLAFAFSHKHTCDEHKDKNFRLSCC